MDLPPQPSGSPGAAPSAAGGEAEPAVDGRRGPTSTRKSDKAEEERAPQSPAPGEKAVELGAVTMPVMKDCVRDCVQRNAMRAEGAAQIESECKQACLDGCQKRCDAEAPNRASGFGEQCRQDCERQTASVHF